VVCLVAACQSPVDGQPDGTGSAVTVFAASSLTDAFRAVADELHAGTPPLRVTLALAGSQRLALQLQDGAAADVFASADARQIEIVADSGLLAGPPRPFASNRLALAVEPGNPTDIQGLEDLADPSLAVVLAAPQVPAGRYAQLALERAGVTVTPVSLENDVRGVVGKVALGEADAGVVYVSDVVAADGRVAAVEIPPAHNVEVTYLIGALGDAQDPSAAEAFISFLLSPAGQSILQRSGFAP
jgi:molybdate transport system substrate-binding protein